MTTKKSKAIVLSSREAPPERRISEKDLAVMKIMAQKQIEILTSKTPEYAIKRRPGGGGRTLRYVPHGYVTDVLNKAFGFDWDCNLLPYFNGNVYHQVDVDTGTKYGQKHPKAGWPVIRHTLSVCTELVIRIHNPNKASELIATIRKTGVGSSIWYEENEWGDSLKAAESDGLKVAASKLGIALDLYWDDTSEIANYEEEQRKRYEQEEIIDALERKEDYPVNGVSMIALASSRFGFDGTKLMELFEKDLPKIISEYAPSDWDIIMKAGNNGESETTKAKRKK